MGKRFFIENITENKQGISPSLSLKLVSYSRKVGTYFLVVLPTAICIGSLFSVTITAKNADGSTDKQYKGDCTITENGAGTLSPTTIASADWENGVVVKALTYTVAAEGETLVITITDDDKPWILGSDRAVVEEPQDFSVSSEISVSESAEIAVQTPSPPPTLEISVSSDISISENIESVVEHWITYGSEGSGVGEFNQPRGIHYDVASEYIYVADTIYLGNHRIVKTKIDGTGWITYGSEGSGVGQFNQPKGIYYDATSGYIYIADFWNYRVVKTKIDGTGWTTYGSSGSGVGQFDKPSDIHYDTASGYIYIVDFYTNHRIVKTKIDGTGWTTYGSSGSGVGQFGAGGRIYYDATSGYIYIADYWNSRIVKTKIDGTGWTTYGSWGSGVGEFYYPGGIYYDDASEYIYVVDNHRIVKTKIDGTGWTTYGSSGSGVGQFDSFGDIHYDAVNGLIYVNDRGNYRIVETNGLFM